MWSRGCPEVHGGAGGELVFVAGVAEQVPEPLHHVRVTFQMSSGGTKENCGSVGPLESVEGAGEAEYRLGGNDDVAALVVHLDGAVVEVEAELGVAVADLDGCGASGCFGLPEG